MVETFTINNWLVAKKKQKKTDIFLEFTSFCFIHTDQEWLVYG